MSTLSPKPPLALTLLVTWGGSGLSPKAPGTVGSLAALPFAAALVWAVGPLWGPWVLAAASLAVFFLGWWASSLYIAHTGGEDPKDVVIDEVAGQWLALVPAALDPVLFALAFGMFRVFDILKPWPIGWADRRLPGGLGIMADDMLAGLGAAMVVGDVAVIVL